jgi:hypothetical protein
MKPLHEELKAIREEKNISLDYISHMTKIRVNLLEKLEQGDFTFAPQPYIRAFLGEYATVIGIDPQQVLARFTSSLSRPKDGILSDEKVQVETGLTIGATIDESPLQENPKDVSSQLPQEKSKITSYKKVPSKRASSQKKKKQTKTQSNAPITTASPLPQETEAVAPVNKHIADKNDTVIQSSEIGLNDQTKYEQPLVVETEAALSQIPSETEESHHSLSSIPTKNERTIIVTPRLSNSLFFIIFILLIIIAALIIFWMNHAG